MLSESVTFLLLLCAQLTAAQSSAQQCRAAFKQLNNGLLCVRSDFTRTVQGIAGDAPCSLECSKEPRCRAFTTADGPCQLFEFDKCSKSVRDCGCSRRGRLFVKQQPGLEPGALCPSGYGNDLCGVKYRLVTSSSGTWSVQKLFCDSEPGLVIMADVTDAAEFSHVTGIYKALGTSSAVFVSGYRTFRGAALTDGWRWLSCNSTLETFVWGPDEPNSFDEKASALYSSVDNLVDIRDTVSAGVMCECVSPFN